MPTAMWEIAPSLPKVTSAEAIPHTLPRLQWTMSCDAASSARLAAAAGKWAKGSPAGGRPAVSAAEAETDVEGEAEADAEADAGGAAAEDAGSGDAAGTGETEAGTTMVADAGWRLFTKITAPTPADDPTTA